MVKETTNMLVDVSQDFHLLFDDSQRLDANEVLNYLDETLGVSMLRPQQRHKVLDISYNPVNTSPSQSPSVHIDYVVFQENGASDVITIVTEPRTNNDTDPDMFSNMQHIVHNDVNIYVVEDSDSDVHSIAVQQPNQRFVAQQLTGQGTCLQNLLQFVFDSMQIERQAEDHISQCVTI